MCQNLKKIAILTFKLKKLVRGDVNLHY